MKVYNNTLYTDENIEAMPFLKFVRNEWRERNIQLRQAPNGLILSDGITFDRKMRVISLETREEWARELDDPRSFVITK